MRITVQLPDLEVTEDELAEMEEGLSKQIAKSLGCSQDDVSSKIEPGDPVLENLRKLAFQDPIENVIDAWEDLPGGIHYTAEQIQEWLVEKMSPAIDELRKHIGREKPKG